ncbi:MAG TPA: zinc-binding alcohol dehydrogenase family protein [Sedimentisphaerales bacterium]|nr:zinc-binding alcohol dehydrogenase family protein [Sedimentisphaerales bacterium]
MKALYIVEPGKTELREIERPKPADGEVLLRVGMVGFCGGDLNAFKGTMPMQYYPMILGHEIGAVIEEIGPGVPDKFQRGMKVTVSPYQSCGHCTPCKRGRPNACRDNRTMGVRRPGAMTEYITAPFGDIHPSQKLGLKELAIVEPLTVGFHAAARGCVSEFDKVAVLGCGIVGIGAVVGSSARGAEVIAVDIDDRKLQIARKAGARHAINSSEGDLHNALGELTDGEGPDVVIEAVGLAGTFRAAVEEVVFTGRVVYIGYAKSPVEYETKLFVQKELDILGSRNCLGDFPRVIEELEKGGFPVDDVVTRVVPLAEAGQALVDWNKDPNKVTKIMVDMEA